MAKSRNSVREAEQQNVIISAERLPVPIGLAERFGYDRAAWRALCEAVFPSAKTAGSIVLALAYCKARKLDPFKRVVHIVPMWNSTLNREVETVWPGIAEHRTTASRTGDYAGNDAAEFGPTVRQSFKAEKTTSAGKLIKAELKDLDFPEWCQMTLYRMVQGHRVSFVGPRVYFREYFGYRKGLPVPNERWTRAPAQMLEKCAEAAALRRAYPEEMSEPVAEEMDGRTIEAGGVVIENGEGAPKAGDFKNDKAVPSDGVIQAFDDEDEFEDDPAIKVVEPAKDPAPAAQAAPTAEASPKVPQGTLSDAPPVQEAQAAPPKAAPAPEGDGRPEPPPPEGVVEEAQVAPQRAEAVDHQENLEVMVDKAIADLPNLGDVPAIKDLNRKARAKIDEAVGVTDAAKSRLRGKLNAACLDREKVFAGKARR